MRTLAFVSIISITCFFLAAVPTRVCSDEQHAAPKVELELVHTDVNPLGNVGLFLLVTNPNDFDVYVCISSVGSVTGGKSEVIGDGPAASRESDFSLVAARSKLLWQIERDYALNPGMNHLRIRVAGVMAPKATVPWNYICASHRSELAILNDQNK